MKYNFHHRFLLAIAIMVCTALGVRAQSVPSLINYQGKLTDAGGAPLPNGTYGIAVKLWSKKSSSTPGDVLVWGQEYNVVVQNGIFNVILGSPGGTPIAGAAVNDLSFAFTDPARYFGLTVTKGTNGAAIPNTIEIVPRQQVLSAPFSIAAGNGVPTGGVIMWSGSVANIPAGWALCNGNNNTPDLRDKFVVGAASTYNVGAVGGSATHSHDAGTYSAPAHTHTLMTRGGLPGTDISDYVMLGAGGWLLNEGADAYSGTIVNYQTTDGQGGGQISGTSAVASSLPPFYALAFIIKL